MVCACLGCHLSRYITLSYTSMEVSVVLAGQRMKNIRLFLPCIFSCLSEQRYRGSFRQNLPPVFLDLGRSIVEEIREAKTYISSRGSQLRYEGMRHLFLDLQCDYFL